MIVASGISSIGRLLQEHRRQNKISARKLAQEANLCHHTLIALENGADPSVTTLRKLAATLGLQLTISLSTDDS